MEERLKEVGWSEKIGWKKLNLLENNDEWRTKNVKYIVLNEKVKNLKHMNEKIS